MHNYAHSRFTDSVTSYNMRENNVVLFYFMFKEYTLAIYSSHVMKQQCY